MKIVRLQSNGEKTRVRRKLTCVKDGNILSSSAFVALPKGGNTYSRRTSHHRFVFCLKGNMRIDSRFYWDEVMSEGQMAFVPGGWNLYLKALEESEVLIFSCASIYFGGDDEFLDYVSEYRGAEIKFLRMEENLSELVRHIASQTATKRFVLSEVCESWRMQLMITLESYYPKGELAAFLCRVFKQKVDFKAMVAATYRDAGRSIGRLAKLCGMSRGSLYNQFKRECGMMPEEWMNERIKEDMLQAAKIHNVTREGLGYVMKMTQRQLSHFIRRHFDCTVQEFIDSNR